ncbi:hypothetical protein V8G61_00515 [Gaetbulibacter sp. M240]|uniref:hypothetical protein n=1 Tax=Gaetbulibacter sp. M240 TaxID=3126511 RepID=UPI00374FB3E2
MSKVLSYQKNIFIFGIPVLIFSLMVLIAKSSWFPMNPDHLALGITADLLITTPFIYFLLVRKSEIPKLSVVPVLGLGILLCTLILPTENQNYLNLFKLWVLPVVEGTILFYILYQLRKAIKLYRQKRELSFDFFTVLKNTCSEILPKHVANLFATEIAVFYYGFFSWKKRVLKPHEFSYHKESGSITLLVAIIFIATIETFVFHMLLAKWSDLLAWIVTILSIYCGLQLFGFLKSMFYRPLSIEDNKLLLRYGIMGESVIDLKNIDSIEISSKDIEPNTETKKLSFLGSLESHNVIIHLKEENELFGLYGFKKKYKNLALFVDNKAVFANELNEVLGVPKT